jgi:hypothetical protein
MELLQLGFFSLGSRCNRPGRGGRRKRRGSGREKSDRVSPGFDRVDRFPGRPGGSTGFPRANSQAGFSLHPDRSQARVGRVTGRPAGPVRVLKHCFFQPVGQNHVVHRPLFLFSFFFKHTVLAFAIIIFIAKIS